MLPVLRPLPIPNETRLALEEIAVDDLKLNLSNPRTHSRQQIRQIKRSIQNFGFTNPLLVDEHNTIIAGHGRLAAARLLGFTTVPIIRVSHLSYMQKQALLLADNKIAANAGWDRQVLCTILQDIAEFDYDLVLETGFDAPELELLLTPSEGVADDPAADVIPEPDPATPAISRLGDCWVLGRHRLLCGDATSPLAYRQLLAGEKAQMVFCDPPYNVPIDGHVCGLGKIRHREFAMASGEMSESEFTAFLTAIVYLLIAYSLDGSIHYICMDWRHVYELMTAARGRYHELKNICVWRKSNAGMGTFYRSQHELVAVFKNGTGRHINNFELGQHGRYRTNVWDYPGVNSLSAERSNDLHLHPTVKPVALVADAIRDCSTRNGIVLDCFAGSGTTIIAAESTGRRAHVMEIDPLYVDTAIHRWQGYTGDIAIHEGTGQSYAELAARRATDANNNPAPETHHD